MTEDQASIRATPWPCSRCRKLHKSSDPMACVRVDLDTARQEIDRLRAALTARDKGIETAEEALHVLSARQCASACLDKVKPEDKDIRYPWWQDRCGKHVANHALAAMAAVKEQG